MIIENLLIINYLFVFVVYLSHFQRIADNKPGYSKKELMLLLIPFCFLFCVVELLIIILKEAIIEFFIGEKGNE